MAVGPPLQNIGDQIAISRIDASGLNGKPEGHKPRFRCLESKTALPHTKMGEREMSIRLSRVATRLLVVAAMALLPGLCWAVYYQLGLSSTIRNVPLGFFLT